MSLELKPEIGKSPTSERITRIYLILVVLASVAAGYFFPVWGWGLSLTAGFAWPVTAAFALISLIGLVPLIRNKIKNLLEHLAALFAANLTPSRIVILALAAGVIPVIYVIKCPLMGDGIIHIYGSYPHVGWRQSIHPHFPFFSAAYIGLYQALQFAIGRSMPLILGATEKSLLVWSVLGFLAAFIFIYALSGLVLQMSRERSRAFFPFIMVLTSGTLALLTGFVEVTPLYLAVLALYLRESLKAGRQGSFPTLPPYLFFLCLGLHASAVALLPSLVFLIYRGKSGFTGKPLKILHLIVPAIVFIGLVWKLVGLQNYLSQFLSGAEVMEGPGKAAGDMAYGLFSPEHLIELLNVALLHNPLNLLWSAWIIYALFSKWRILFKDRQATVLIITLFSYAVILSLFHPVLGMLRDWDIYSPLGLLLPLTAWKLWDVSTSKSRFQHSSGVLAVVTPLAACQLALWVFTLHSPERIINFIVKYAETGKHIGERGRELLGSNLSIYSTENNYFPEYLIDYIGNMEEARRFTIYRLGERPDKQDLMLRLAERWSDKISEIDLNNLAGSLFYSNRLDEALYYLRLATNRTSGLEYTESSISNLAGYYINTNRNVVSYYYESFLPAAILSKREPLLLETLKRWHESGVLIDSVVWMKENAAMSVFNNGVALLKRGKFKSAEQELIASMKLGIDSLRVMPLVNSIREAAEAREESDSTTDGKP